MNAVVKQLEQTLGTDAVIQGSALSQRATSFWSPSPTEAQALVRPRNTDELSKALAICHAQDQPVVIQGGKTGCAQGADARSNEIIVSTERMTAIESVDDQGGTAIVQAGAILQNVQESLAGQGWLFPLDLGARGSCTIGGNIATNAGGINVLRYGMARNLILGLEVVLADGRVLSSMNQMLKNNAGYDLKQLFIGTEGTLGIVSRAVLKLWPLPKSCCTALAAISDFEQATELLFLLQREFAGTLSAYELMWNNYYKAVTEPGWHRAPLEREYPYYAIFEIEGLDADADRSRFETILEQALERGLIVDAVIPKNEAERRAIWAIREDFEAITASQPYLYDVSLPIRHMHGYIQKIFQSFDVAEPPVDCYVFGHIADGNLHLFVDPRENAMTQAQSNQIVYQPLAECDGSVTAEHGIGVEKKSWLSHSRSVEEIEVMKALKNTLDPNGILNPGRVVDT